MALLIHDPRDVEKIPKRTPITESYWQRGCNDAKAGRPEKWPSKGGGFDRRNVGYANGYAFGRKAGVAGSRMGNYRVSTDMRGHTVVEAHMACINGLSAWVMVADLGKEHLEDQMFGGFDRDAIGQKIVAALGVAETPEPFWHAVVSDEAPVINKAIRRADVAEEYAQNCRENGYQRIEVVPLYRRPPGVALPSVPQGWSLVPASPTPAMLAAADKIVDSDPRFVVAAYRAMLAAAPTQPLCRECDGAGEFESALHCEKCDACGGTGKRNDGVGPTEPQQEK